MKDAMYWSVWVVLMLVSVTFIAVASSLIFKFGKVIAAANLLIIILMFFLFGVSTIFLSLILVAFFSEPQTAQLFTMLFVTIMGVPTYFFTIANAGQTSLAVKNIACLLSPTAFTLGIKIMSQMEVNGLGAQWDSFADRNATAYEFSVADTMVMMVVDTLIYAAVAWYVPQIVPQQYGTVQPWHFPFHLSYWRGQSDGESAVLADGRKGSVWDQGAQMESLDDQGKPGTGGKVSKLAVLLASDH